MNYYTADLHLGCKNKYEGRTLEHDKLIKERWNSRVTNGDTVYILGDIGREGNNKDNEYLCEIISTLKGKKVLIQGNHEKVNDIRIRQLFTEVCSYKEVSDNSKGRVRNLILCHYPILMWKNQHGGKSRNPYIHLYAHLHMTDEWRIYENALSQLNEAFAERRSLGDECSDPVVAINCGTMIWDFTPRTIDEMLSSYDDKKKLWLASV